MAVEKAFLSYENCTKLMGIYIYIYITSAFSLSHTQYIYI